MVPEILSFSHNWNRKLNCNCFTTLRLHNPQKFQVGKVFEIQLNKATLGNAVVKDIRSFRLNQLNSFITYLDTGYDVAETQKIIKTMYKNANINWDVRLLDFVLFVYQY